MVHDPMRSAEKAAQSASARLCAVAADECKTFKALYDNLSAACAAQPAAIAAVGSRGDATCDQGGLCD